MKKALKSSIFTIMLFTTIPMNYIYAENIEINVLIDDIPISFTDARPLIVSERTLVPIRGVFEALGFEISWNVETNTATLTSDDDTILMVVEQENIVVNGKEITLDVPPQIIDGRLYLPLRGIAEATSNDVNWNGENSTVSIGHVE